MNRKKRVREQRNFLSITLNSIGDGVIITDKEGKIVRLNKTAQELTKWEAKAARDSDITEVFKIINSKNWKKG